MNIRQAKAHPVDDTCKSNDRYPEVHLPPDNQVGKIDSALVNPGAMSGL